MTGVIRIALIGSLATDKPDPKDANVLVTVTDDANLEPLATLGRKLAGHAQSFRRGGDVFLADPRGNYLGRTRPWRECAPGIRMRCDALHCGRRPYLINSSITVTFRSRARPRAWAAVTTSGDMVAATAAMCRPTVSSNRRELATAGWRDTSAYSSTARTCRAGF